MEPVAEQLYLPKPYGEPSKLLEWATVRRMLEDARHYWLSSTRPDGRPHSVPRDGIWIDDTLYYGGDPSTVHHRNIQANPRVAMHVGDGWTAVVVEGAVHQMRPDEELAKLLAAGSEKYRELGYAQSADDYLQQDMLALPAERVIAWTTLYEDATRFRFDRG